MLKAFGAGAFLLEFFSYLAQGGSTYCNVKYQEMSEDKFHTAWALFILKSEQQKSSTQFIHTRFLLLQFCLFFIIKSALINISVIH